MNIAIVGAGKIGYQLAKRFSTVKGNIVIIEIEPSIAQYARDHLDAMVIEGNCTSYELMRGAAIGTYDVFVALTNNDEANIIACKMAKKMGVPTTIARIKNIEYISNEFILSHEDMGVDLLVQPEQETAKAISRLIYLASSTDSIELENGKIHFTGLRLDANAKVLRKPLAEIGTSYSDIPMRIVAIKRGMRTIVPRGSDFLMKGDQIFFICHNDYFKKALEIFGKDNVKIQNIMIVGGGQIAYFIAKELDSKLNIKIIENNEAKANQIANKLKKSLVIHGDGSDLDLLVLEGLTDMDEFIAVTGDDESNIITSIIARHLTVPRTITLINKNEYLPLSGTLGLDAVVSKHQITVNAIESFIKRQTVSNIADLPGVDAEIIVFIANDKTKITRKPLKDISFPRNTIIGAVLSQDGTLTIPQGDTHIQAGDKVVVFAHVEQIKAIEKIFK